MKQKIFARACLALIIVCPLLSCSSENPSETRSLTEEEAVSYVAAIVSDLKDDTSELHKKFYGPRSLVVEDSSSSSNAETTFITDIDDGYYYHVIKCWYEELNDCVTSTRWLYGSEDNFSAGYIAVQSDGTIIGQEEWTYDVALNTCSRFPTAAGMARISTKYHTLTPIIAIPR